MRRILSVPCGTMVNRTSRFTEGTPLFFSRQSSTTFGYSSCATPLWLILRTTTKYPLAPKFLSNVYAPLFYDGCHHSPLRDRHHVCHSIRGSQDTGCSPSHS